MENKNNSEILLYKTEDGEINIDQMVYKLYGLTEEEMKIVEDEV